MINAIDMLSPEAAWQRIAAHLTPLGSESRERRQALGQVLAEALAATTDVPPEDVSAMDGFALAGDVEGGARLAVAGTVAAGDPPGAELQAGTAWRIWTGAPVPAGADRVVPVERTRPAGEAEDVVEVLEPVALGANIRRRGEILRRGQALLPADARLGPAALGLLASQGVSEVAVRRLPSLAIVATGDEVVPPERAPAPGQLRDSHTDFLLAAAGRLATPVTSFGIEPDDPKRLRATIARALERHDVTLVCGGVSMGGRDHTEAALAELGAEIVFHGVAVQPGKPLLFAVRGDRWIFGLPGNPASVMVSFRLFVQPALERLAGRDAAFWSDARVVELAAPLAAGKARDRFVPARRVGRSKDGRERVSPLGVRGSHDLATFGVAEYLLRVPREGPAREAGETAEAIGWE